MFTKTKLMAILTTYLYSRFVVVQYYDILCDSKNNLSNKKKKLYEFANL